MQILKISQAAEIPVTGICTELRKYVAGPNRVNIVLKGGGAVAKS